MDSKMTPEEQALSGAYVRLAAGRTLLMSAAVALVLALMAADFALAVAAMWVVPAWAALLLACFLVEEIVRLTAVHGGIEAETRRRNRGLTRAQRKEAAVERIRVQDPPLPWWLAGPRTGRFWGGVAGRSVFAAAEFAVLSHWLGHPLGFVLTACLTVLAFGARSAMMEAAARWRQVVNFTFPEA